MEKCGFEIGIVSVKDSPFTQTNYCTAIDTSTNNHIPDNDITCIQSSFVVSLERLCTRDPTGNSKKQQSFTTLTDYIMLGI